MSDTGKHSRNGILSRLKTFSWILWKVQGLSKIIRVSMPLQEGWHLPTHWLWSGLRYKSPSQQLPFISISGSALVLIMVQLSWLFITHACRSDKVLSQLHSQNVYHIILVHSKISTHDAKVYPLTSSWPKPRKFLILEITSPIPLHPSSLARGTCLSHTHKANEDYALNKYINSLSKWMSCNAAVVVQICVWVILHCLTSILIR